MRSLQPEAILIYKYYFAYWKVFAACTRFVCVIWRRDIIDEYVMRIIGCKLLEYLKYLRNVFMHKLLTSREPEYLYNKLHISTRSKVLILPRHTSSQYNKSFFVSAAVCYNSLPKAMMSCRTIANFKRCCFQLFAVWNAEWPSTLPPYHVTAPHKHCCLSFCDFFSCCH